MHYYKRNIGDYAKKAGRLSMLEHGAYTLLIDACYDRERFPTLDDAIDWVWARTEAEIEAVKFILTRFFELRDGVYVQHRIEEEITKYHENAAKNARIATEREEKRRERARTVNEAPPNQEPRTKNHKPRTNNKNIAPDGELFADVPQQIVDDFKTMRAKQRAPITKTAIDGIQREALKAGLSFPAALQICIERNWRGFKADWMLQPSRGSPQGYESTRDKSRREAMEKLTGKKSNGPPDFIDIN